MYFFNFDFKYRTSPEILIRLRDNKITIRPIAEHAKRINKKQDNFYMKDLLNDKGIGWTLNVAWSW